jgi:hypothetical protein
VGVTGVPLLTLGDVGVVRSDIVGRPGALIGVPTLCVGDGVLTLFFGLSPSDANRLIVGDVFQSELLTPPKLIFSLLLLKSFMNEATS